MKRIIELSENDYKALKEDGVQNHLALANTIIACSIPYEPQIEIVPVCKVIFDKEQLQEIVDKRVAELVADNKRPQGECKGGFQLTELRRWLTSQGYSEGTVDDKINEFTRFVEKMRGEEE